MHKKIGLGTWSWGNKFFWGYQTNKDDQLEETYKEALKRGFAFIDTADSYGTGRLSGRSEELLGRYLSQTSNATKNRITIATKLAPYPWRIGRKGFKEPFLRSFHRLNKKLDIVQLHWSTSRYNPWQEFQFLDCLCDLIDDGFDFQIGLSNVGPKNLKKIIEYLAQREKKLKSVQVQFSLLCPDLKKQLKVKQICNQNNIDFLAYSPLSFGILSLNSNNKSSLARNLMFKTFDKSILELRKCLKIVSENRKVSPAQVAVNWVCYQGAIPIVGLRKKVHVKDISGILKWDLNRSEFEMLQNASYKCALKMPGNPFTSN